MRLIKNFLHNINDVVLAIVIVALAAGIIYWRMQIILDYPKQLADNQAAVAEEVSEDAAADEATGGAAGDQAEQPAEQAGTEEQPQG